MEAGHGDREEVVSRLNPVLQSISSLAIDTTPIDDDVANLDQLGAKLVVKRVQEYIRTILFAISVESSGAILLRANFRNSYDQRAKKLAQEFMGEQNSHRLDQLLQIDIRLSDLLEKLRI